MAKKNETVMVEASKCKCCICGKQSYAFWPCIDTDIPQHPYCEKCLREQQMNVITGVLGEEEGKNGVTEYEHLCGTKNDNKDE